MPENATVIFKIIMTVMLKIKNKEKFFTSAEISVIIYAD